MLLVQCLGLPFAHADELTRLAASDTWLKLLHVQNGLLGAGQSAIHDPAFFLSPEGRQDPEAELRATLAAMRLPLAGGEPDQHAKCRFPARRQWLSQQLPAQAEALREIECPEFADWLKLDELGSVSVVFANGYLGNPASYYGHLFLKFNTARGSKSYLIEQTANFGALNTTGDNPAVYIVKAMAGGYDGGFSPVDFFFHGANYGENELRDLWEYQLDLPLAEARFIAAHAWEVNKKRYTYYFFHDNCAFRVAELLEVAPGVEATPSAPWIVPQAVLQTLHKARYDGHPLIGKRVFHPSRESRLRQRLARLDPRQKTYLRQIIAGQADYRDAAVTALPVADQQSLIDTALDYHQSLKPEIDERGEKKLSAPYVAALSARMALPPGGAESAFAEPGGPETGLPPGWVQLGMAYTQRQGQMQSLRIRPAYYDALDAGPAQARFGGLSMGDIRVDVDARRVRITHLDVVAVSSIKHAVTGLPGDNNLGWRMRLGLERERMQAEQALLPKFEADAIGGWRLGSGDLVAYVNLGGALQSHGALDGMGFLRAGAGVVGTLPGRVSLRLADEMRRPFGGVDTPYRVSVFESRLPVGTLSDLRLLWERAGQTRITLGLGFYW